MISCYICTVIIIITCSRVESIRSVLKICKTVEIIGDSVNYIVGDLVNYMLCSEMLYCVIDILIIRIGLSTAYVKLVHNITWSMIIRPLWMYVKV